MIGKGGNSICLKDCRLFNAFDTSGTVRFGDRSTVDGEERRGSHDGINDWGMPVRSTKDKMIWLYQAQYCLLVRQRIVQARGDVRTDSNSHPHT